MGQVNDRWRCAGDNVLVVRDTVVLAVPSFALSSDESCKEGVGSARAGICVLQLLVYLNTNITTHQRNSIFDDDRRIVNAELCGRQCRTGTAKTVANERNGIA
jgi:hypothetical protein